MRLFRSTVLVFAAMALAVVALKARQQKTGSPEDHLPSNITQLTAFGERASWSPDGQRIAFMSKSFGDAFVVDIKTKMIRLLTHYPNRRLPPRPVPAERRSFPDRRPRVRRHPDHALT